MSTKTLRLLVATMALTLLFGACSATPSAEPKEVTINLIGGKPESVVRIDVAGGAKVKLHITSDRVDTVHVHGYELEFGVGPDKTVTKEFVADQLGTYEIETHKDASIIAQLVVR